MCTEHSIKNDWRIWVEFWLGQFVPDANVCCKYNCWAYQVQNNYFAFSISRAHIKVIHLFNFFLFFFFMSVSDHWRCYAQLNLYLDFTRGKRATFEKRKKSSWIGHFKITTTQSNNNVNRTRYRLFKVEMLTLNSLCSFAILMVKVGGRIKEMFLFDSFKFFRDSDNKHIAHGDEKCLSHQLFQKFSNPL